MWNWKCLPFPFFAHEKSEKKNCFKLFCTFPKQLGWGPILFPPQLPLFYEERSGPSILRNANFGSVGPQSTPIRFDFRQKAICQIRLKKIVQKELLTLQDHKQKNQVCTELNEFIHASKFTQRRLFMHLYVKTMICGNMRN